MNRLYSYIKEKNYNIIIASVYFIGICIHGSRIFTAYYAHDDATMVGVGTTYTSGRWFLQALYKLQMLIMGSSINAKGFMGMAVLALFAIICCMIAYGLGIKKKKSFVLLSGVIITFPYIPSLLSYTYTAPHYCISIIMSLLAAILIQGGNRFKQKLLRIVFGAVLLGLSMAIYQTSLCVYVAFIAVFAVMFSLDTQTETWKSFLQRCLGYLSGCIGGCLFYYVSNKSVLAIKGFSMSGYQGLDQMEQISPQQFFSRALLAYKEFFNPAPDLNYSFYHQAPVRFCYSLILMVCFICALICILREIKCKNYAKVVQLFILFCIIPLAVNSVFLTADTSSTNIYSLMMFSESAIQVFLIGVLERLNLNGGKNTKLWKTRNAVHSIAVLSLVYMMIYFGYIANVCYTKAAIQQEQTIGYFNRLIMRIQMTEGYSPDMSVAYIYEWNKNIENQSIGFIYDDGYSIAAYNYTSLINMYNWKEYMKMWCGFRPPEVSYEELQEYLSMQEVMDMPTYPYDGSIKVIDNVIVVKFDPY